MGAQAAELDCTTGGRVLGLCPSNPPTSSGDIDDDHVDVSAGIDGGIGGKDGKLALGFDDPSGDGDDPADPEAADPGCGPQGGLIICRDDFIFNLAGTDLPWQEITLADIASFVPEAPARSAEPDGWAIVGLPANFVAGAEQHIIPGTLLGLPAEVRFTPTSYLWDYGDGSSGTSVDGGSTWDALGLDWFAMTSTSHSYESRGAVTALLTISYEAEYRFAGPTWNPVVGILDVAGDPMAIVVATESTVLVGGSCGPDSSLGC